MDPISVGLGAKALGLLRRFWPHAVGLVAVALLVWVITDRIKDAEATRDMAVAAKAKAEANELVWRTASTKQTEAIRNLAKAQNDLVASMSGRDAQAEELWRRTLEATRLLDDTAQKLIDRPASTDEVAAARASLKQTQGYGYVLRVELPPATPAPIPGGSAK